MMARFYALGIAVLLLGSVVGTVSLQSNFALLEKYQINAEINYVFFNIGGANSTISSLEHLDLLTYIMILNITNPSNKTILLQDAQIDIATNVNASYSGVTITDSLVSCYRYFSQNDTSYMIQPHASKLLLFSGVIETNPKLFGSSLGTSPVSYYVDVQGHSLEGGYASTTPSSKTIQLTIVNQTEYVYSTLPSNESLHFRSDGPNIIFEIAG